MIRWRRWRVRFRRALKPLRPVRELIQGPEEGQRKRGFSLIEVAIGVAVSVMVFSAVHAIAKSAVGGDRTLRVRVDLQLDAGRILQDVTGLLKTSAPVDANGDRAFDPGDYPYVWTDGTDNASRFGGSYAYLDRANAGIVPRATSSEEGQGPSKEIAFRRPREPGSFAIVLVPGPDGNELQLRRYDESFALASTRILGRHVERITFETVPQDPLAAHQVRVTAWLRRVIDRKVYVVRQSCTADLRSPEPAPRRAAEESAARR